MLRTAGKGDQESNRNGKMEQSGIEHLGRTFANSRARGRTMCGAAPLDLLGRFEGSREGCVSCRLVDPDTLPSHPPKRQRRWAFSIVSRHSQNGSQPTRRCGRRASRRFPRTNRSCSRRSRAPTTILACVAPRSASWAPSPVLADAVRSDADEGVRDEAAGVLLDIALGAYEADEPSSRAAVEALAHLPGASAQKHLLLVAKTAKRESVSRAALGGLVADQKALGSVARRAEVPAIRLEALAATHRSRGAAGDGLAQQLPRRVGGGARAHRERSCDAQERGDPRREPGRGPPGPLAVARAGRRRRGRSGARKGARGRPRGPPPRLARSDS